MTGMLAVLATGPPGLSGLETPPERQGSSSLRTSSSVSGTLY